MASIGFAEKNYHSQDGLKLYYRDYTASTTPGTPVICLPGLTRNSADFHNLAQHLCAQGRRVICPDLRGRGRADHDANYKNYAPPVELSDVLTLMDTIAVSRAIFVGTSRGGLLTLMMTTVRPDALVGVILNDIGPDLDPRGVARIADYVGTGQVPDTWDAAAALLRAREEAFFPKLSPDQWMEFARRLFLEDETGRPASSYDPHIGTALREALARAGSSPPDLWPLFRNLAMVPTLLIRGAYSDLLSVETTARMRAEKPDLAFVEIDDRGHPPFLDEPAARTAIDAFIASL